MNDFDSIIKRMTVTRLEPGDYTGEDGLLYCGKCRTPKQFRMDAPPLEGRLLPHPCRCEQERLDREAAEQEARRHRQAVADLKSKGFTDPAMRTWTFANDNGKCPQMKHAHFYVENWTAMQEENIGYLLWGGVGTGKSYFAGCIANALLDQDVPVLMTNFPTILSRLCGTFGEDITAFLDSLGDYDLLIIDDLGAERNTEYALEQMFSIIDSRYRSNKPLIVTTNLKLDELKHPPDLAHARIYDRILERCAPILFAGKNFREDNAASTKAAARCIVSADHSKI